MTFAQPFTDYEILDRVGAGAMGTVFKARHKKLGRIVALKVLKPSLARDSRYVDRLRREARIVASLNHPHIVTGYDLGEEGGYHFFVMEFVEGKSLRALLVEWGMFAEEYVLRVGQQVAQALDHAYQRGVIHRDVKPGNILIDEQGNLKLTDMGLAKGPADLTLTRDGATVGTPQYISPEQARNPQDVDVRSDLYSLGATLYHMATGVPPFRGDTMAELITKVLHDPPVPPNEVNPALSEGLSLVLRKLLAKDLRVRYQTPRELLDDLDRVQRAQPPQVDAARLSAGEERRSNAVLRSLATLGVVLVLGGAVWLGMQFRGAPAVERPAAEQFLADLDSTLRDLPTPGARLQHLRSIRAGAPDGTEVVLLQRERTVLGALQQAVDDTAAGFLDSGWVAFSSWLRDPAVWPDRQRAERERVLPRLRERAGMPREQLEGIVRLDRIDGLMAAIERELRDRDAGLLRRLDAYLATALPTLVDERLRASDFAGAERLWNDALSGFVATGREPSRERLAEATLQKANDRVGLESKRALPRIDAAEASVADALRGEADEVLRHHAERLAAGADPELVGGAVAQLRQDLLLVWPGPSRFRPDRNPWPGVDRRIGELQRAVALADAEVSARRFDHRCDLAWRAVCNGTPADGLAVLHGLVPPGERQATALVQHHRALTAARAVQDALLAALGRAGTAVPAFLRSGSGLAVQVHVESEGAGPVLLCQAVGQPVRRAQLSEFRFGELLAQVQKLGGDPLAGVPREEAALGTAVFQIVGDELAGLAARLETIGQPFLVEEVWPRVLRVRGERDETVGDRASWFARLREAHESALRGGDLHELEAAIQTCVLRVAEDQRTDAERLGLRTAQVSLELLRRVGDVRGELEKSVPAGASVVVEANSGAVVGTVTVPSAALLRGAAEGWQPRGELLEFAGATRPWPELRQQQLQLATGLDGAAARTTVQVDLVLPPPTVGTRFYLFEFRGVAVALVLGGNDAVHASVLDGDLRKEEWAQKSFLDAIGGLLTAPRAFAVPGGVHRLVIDIATPQRGRQALIKVLFEGVELAARQRAIDPTKPANLVVVPRQELAVQQVVVRGSGL